MNVKEVDMDFTVLGIDVAYMHSPHASDLARWYADTLDLEIFYEDGHWFEFAVPQGSRFAIDGTGFPRSSVEAQSVVLSFQVDDVRAAVAQLADQGVRFHPSAEDAVFEAGPSLVATFQDPQGQWHQLSQRTAITE